MAREKVETVEGLMTRQPISLAENTPVLDAAQRMREAGVGTVVIRGSDGLSGIVTDRDIVVRCVAQGLEPKKTPLSKIATRNPMTLAPTDELGVAVKLMRSHAIRRAPVVQDGQVVGILSLGDLARAIDPDSALAQISSAPAAH